MASRRNVQYSPLSIDDDDYYTGGNKQHDRRFDYTPKSFDQIPWKSIGLALFLLFLGSLLLFLSFFIYTGHMGGDQSQAVGLMFLGFLTFLPGFYETRIAYYSWRGANGYRFASIPRYYQLANIFLYNISSHHQLRDCSCSRLYFQIRSIC